MREVIEDRYALAELLGRGGFGEVWRAEDSRVGRQVAVKIGYPQTPEDTRRFEREAGLAGNLAHPNIATIHDFGRTEREGRAVREQRRAEGAGGTGGLSRLFGR